MTGDLRIQKNRAERLAFRQANLRELEDVIQRFRPPFLFEVPTSRSAKFRTLPI